MCMRMSLLGLSQLILCPVAVAMTVPSTTVRVSVVVEEEKSDDVGGKAKAAYYQDEERLGYFLRFEESLDGFEEDSHA
jgi:hypothetical protein